jgi:hypothetical protein
MEWFFGFMTGAGIAILILMFTWPNSKVTCETFPNNPQPGLFDAFHGKTCSDNFGVRNIAKNLNQCFKNEDNAQCLTEQYGYFRSSGASENDSAKAMLLILKARYN